MPKATLKILLKGIDCLAKIKFESRQETNTVVAAIKIPKEIEAIVESIIKKARSLPAVEALSFVLQIDNLLYQLIGEQAVRYGNGIHPKHYHTNYHTFFISRISPGSQVLDVGCGNGFLAYEIATQIPRSKVFAIDISARAIKKATDSFRGDNLKFIRGDALKEMPDQAVDVVVLSNVLEHLEQRVLFLKTLAQRYHPQKFLIRVPLFERDWRVPLKKELGIEYRLDRTHQIEYRVGEFFEEISKAGLAMVFSQIKWGEIWAEAVLKKNSDPITLNKIQGQL
jgi:2-polyprenyl-3-methyl-5-hydroxy-6-metoxy-1,4-benzoquinol methylase